MLTNKFLVLNIFRLDVYIFNVCLSVTFAAIAAFVQ